MWRAEEGERLTGPFDWEQIETVRRRVDQAPYRVWED